jgi:hypothetical protein
VNSPTAGSPVPVVPSPNTDKPWRMVADIPTGEYRVVQSPEHLEARVKCQGECETTTAHLGITLASVNAEEGANTLRVYTCTVCGHLSTKR